MSLRTHPEVVEFLHAAERYRSLFESQPDDVNAWIEAVLRTISQLYSLGHRLPDAGLREQSIDVPSAMEVSDEEWRRRFDFVQRLLGRHDAYWAYFDPTEPVDANVAPILHSLADDLADIFRDIIPGLRAWETGNDFYTETVVFDWKEPLFGLHWGVHAASAMRALHPLVYLRGIQQ